MKRFKTVVTMLIMAVLANITAFAGAWVQNAQGGGITMEMVPGLQIPGSGLMGIMMAWQSAIISIRTDTAL